MADDEGFLTKSEIEEFKKIALEDYGVELTDEEAYEQGATLVTFFEHVLKTRLKKQ